MRNKGRGALWVGGVLVYIFLLATVRDLIGGTTGTLSTWLLSALAGTLLWWWTARLMLRGEVRWRPLLPTAALTGLGTSLYAMAADVWMPVTVTGNFAQFGAFGIALSPRPHGWFRLVFPVFLLVIRREERANMTYLRDALERRLQAQLRE
jgi:hypothetical protein